MNALRHLCRSVPPLLDTLGANAKGLLWAAFYLGAAVSFLVRQMEKLLALHGGETWAATDCAHRNLPLWSGWRTQHVLHDLVSGVYASTGLVILPAIVVFAVMGGYRFLLWCGAAVIIVWLGPQFTAYPNLDLILWPPCAGAAQAVLVRGVFSRLKRRGLSALVCTIANVDAAVGVTVATAVILFQILPVIAYFTLAALQLAVVWALKI